MISKTPLRYSFTRDCCHDAECDIGRDEIRVASPRQLATVFRGCSALLLFLSLAAALHGQKIPPYNPPSGPYVPTKMELYTSWAGLWRTDHTFESTIRLSNQLSVSGIDATVTLFMADGTKYVLPAVHLKASGVATVDVNAALAAAPLSLISHISTHGSASVSYRYAWQGVVYSVMSILDVPRSLQYTVPFAFPMSSASMDGGSMTDNVESAPNTTMEGMLWHYSKDSIAFLSLANTSTRDLHVTLSALTEAGQATSVTHFLVPAMNTVLRTIDAEAPDEREERLGGVRISYDGASDALSIVGGIEDDAHGYSANVPMGQLSSGGATSISTGAGAGIMIGKQEAMMGFPSNLRFRPYAFFHNNGDTPIRLNSTLCYGMTQPQSIALPTATIQPHESAKLRFPDLTHSLDGSVTLSFSYNGQADSLLIATGAVDQTGNYVFAVEPRGVGQSVSKSSVYWSTSGGFDTMYSLFNPTDKATDVLLKLAYGGSSTYNYPVHLEPGATAMADIRQIAMMGMPDSSGKVLPLSVQQGSAVLTASSGNDADPINVVVSGGIYNPVTATCGNTCETCNGCTSFPSALTPGTLGLPVSTYGWFYAQCPWYNGNTQTISSYSTSWSSDNTGIATVQANPNPGLSYGNSAGSANISTQMASVPVNIGQICTQGTLPACGTSSPVQSGSASVVPTLSLSNSLWFFGLGNSVSGYPTQTTLIAVGASGGSFAWSITNGTAKASFAINMTQSSTTTSGNQVTVYSIGWSTSASDVSIGLTWTPTNQSPIPAQAISTQIDSPYKLTLANQPQPTAVSDCTNFTPGGTGWWSQYKWNMVSFFGVSLAGMSINENFSDPSDAQPNNCGNSPRTGTQVSREFLYLQTITAF